MKRKIEELEQGSFSRRTPELKVSPESLELRIPEGKQYRGVVTVGADDGSRVKGMVVSSDHRILIANEKFSGNTCDLVFGIDTGGLKSGDITEGRITILSSLGEKTLHLRAVIGEEADRAARKEITALDDFTKLCMKDLREGFRLFTGGQFFHILNGKNRPFRALYRGMSHNPVTYQHMEEFLIAAGKKSPVMLTLDKKQKAVYTLDVSQKDTLYIYKNTWGYIRMEIEVSGDFLQVEKKVVTSEDFIGRLYGLEYIVDRSRLGAGTRYGRIRIRTVYQVLDFEIEASAEEGLLSLSDSVRKRKILGLMRRYLDLQMKKLDYRTWYEQTSQTVQELKEGGESGPLRLFEAFLAYNQDENARAMELLWPVKEGELVLESAQEQAAYLYLAKQVELLPEERRDIAPLLRSLHQQAPEDFLILYLLFQEENVCETTPSRAMYMMEEIYGRGCASPFLYLTAWKMLESQETLLRRLSPFMIQVLRFALKKGLLTQEILERTAYLSSHLKEFSASVYRLLAGGYEQFRSREVLEAVCGLLMKGDPVKKEYFRWYALAVEQDLRITRLYEYYMETIPADSSMELPRPVRMYFLYNNTLGERKKAFLYASIIRHREQDEASYLSYYKQMADFALVSLTKGRIDENFAVLYREFLLKPEQKDQAEDLCRILFKRKLVCSDRKIRSVIVCHSALGEERSYPCQEGTAYVDIYSEDACVIFEDGKRRRFAATVEYTMERLIHEKEAALRCMDLQVAHTGLELYCCKEKSWQMEVNSRTLPCYRLAAENPDFTEEYRRQIRARLLEYYYRHRSERFMTDYLREMDFRAYASVDRVSMIVILIDRAMYEEAFGLAAEFGYEGIPEQKLLRLASRMILRKEREEDEELLCLAAYVAELGKYDEIILSYLRDYYLGSIQSMCWLWKRVKGFQLESYVLDERILLLSIFVHSFPADEAAVLGSYIAQHGRESVILSYLACTAASYFLQGRKTSGEIFRYIEKICEWGWKLDEVCRLALLKWYSGREELTEAQEKRARALLKEFNEKGLRFAFYSRLPAALTQACQIEDKIFVEEYFPAADRVVIHYQLTAEGQEPSGWSEEPMKNMYQGIFVKEFLLFYGETLTFYFSVQEDGKSRDTEKLQLSLADMDTAGITRYKLLNQILAARKLGNREVMEQAVEKYLWQDAYTAALFTLKK